MSYFEFPHTRTYDSDLGWLIRAVREVIDKVDNYNEISFADPLDWDASKSYPLATIVRNDETLYISKENVPAGIDITNTDYWEQLFSVAGSLISDWVDLYDVANVKDYGAIGNGTADDTAAITDAMTSGHKIIYFPKGKYCISHRLTVPDEYLTFIGSGDSTLKLMNYNTSMFLCGKSHTTFENLRFTMDDTSHNYTNIVFINVINQTNGYSMTDVKIDGCEFYNAPIYAMALQSNRDEGRPIDNVVVTRCHTKNVRVGLKNSGGVWNEIITNNVFEEAYGENVTFDGVHRYVTFANNILIHNQGGCGSIGADNSSCVTITGNVFVNWGGGDLQNGITFNRHMGPCSQYIIDGNIFTGCTRAIWSRDADEDYPYIGVGSLICTNNRMISNVQDIVIENLTTSRNIFRNNMTNKGDFSLLYVLKEENLNRLMTLCNIDYPFEFELTQDMVNTGTLANVSGFNKFIVKNGMTDVYYAITGLTAPSASTNIFTLPFGNTEVTPCIAHTADSNHDAIITARHLRIQNNNAAITPTKILSGHARMRTITFM